MWKIIVGIIAVIIVLGGGYWFLSGGGGSNNTLTDAYGTNPTATSTGQTATSTTTGTTTGTNTSTSPNYKTMKATLHTNKGDIVLQFYADQAPKTVENFVTLAQSGFYDGTKFHRVIAGFMDQGGDPLTKDDSQTAKWGTGGPGYTIQDEFATTYTNTAGTVAMANTGAPNSAGSQFFLNAVDNHFLDGKYAVFAKVVSGMDVVTAINKVQTSSDRPLTPVVLTSVKIEQ